MAANALDLFSLEGKVALVTGASRGLGLAMARALGEAGAAVMLSARDPERLAKSAAQLAGAGLKVAAKAFDVAAETGASELVEAAVERFGRLDILVNNAGVTDHVPAMQIDAETWGRVMRTNVDGAFRMAQAAVVPMMNQGGGKIINLSSVYGLMGSKFAVHYSASKAAILGMTKALAHEWAQFNVQVNAIAPGWFDTDMTAIVKEMPEIGAKFVKSIPMRRAGQPEELAGAVIFLASRASDYMTAHTLVVDGGITRY